MDSAQENVLPVADGDIGDGIPEDLPQMPDMKDFKMPSQEELLKMLSNLDLPDLDKDELKKNILSGNFLKQLDPNKNQQHVDSTRIFIVLACVLTMVLVFVFFGYKLYRSQTEKERKREEKRKQKQQKKKHK